MLLIKRFPVRQCRVLNTRLCSRSFNTEQHLGVPESSAHIPGMGEAITEATKTALTSIPEHSFYNIFTVYQSLLDTVQVSTGLPWWWVLIATGVLTRTALFPVNILMEKKQIRDTPHKIRIIELAKAIQIANAKGDKVLALKKIDERKLYTQKYNVRSIFWYFIPASCAMGLNFVAIRGLAELPYQPLVDAPLLWLPNLCVPDPYYILPALNAAMLMYVIKWGIDSGSTTLGDMFKSPSVTFAFMVGCAGFQAFFPGALLVYWCASNAVGLTVISPLMLNNEFRRWAGMVSVAEKKDVMAQMPKTGDLFKQAGETYRMSRETGHAKDKAARLEKLEQLQQRNKDLSKRHG